MNLEEVNAMKRKMFTNADLSTMAAKADYIRPSTTIYKMDLEGVIAASDGLSILDDMPEEDW